MIAHTLSSLLAAWSLLLFIALHFGCDDAHPRARTDRPNRPTSTLPDTDAAPRPAAARVPDSISYNDLLLKIASRRDSLASRYAVARERSERTALLDEARGLMLAAIDDEIFPFWYGTPWDFNGTTQTPGEGKIACGYFVTTILRDAGVQLARVRLAQQASEQIIRSLTTNNHIRRFSNVAIERFVEEVRGWGAGVYVVGLDIHTGFIVVSGSDVSFVHASYVSPRAVVKENALESQILAGSKYRVLGKLTEDDDFLLKWLLKRKL